MTQRFAQRKVDWAKLAADFDRVNRVLIPKTKIEKERFRNSRSVRFVRRLASLAERLSEEGQALAIVLFLSSLAATDVLRSQLHLAWAVFAALLVASLALSWRTALTDVRIEVTAPRRVVVGDEACLSIVVRNSGPRTHCSLRVRGAILPWDGTWTTRRAGIVVVPPHASARTELRARFFARGAHTLDPIAARALVPLGLALGPPALSDGVRILVVPRIARVASIVLPRVRRHHRGGVPRASHTADARELAGVRPYRIGDPVRDLHARTWARIGEPVVREYREEYFTRVGVVLDTDLGDAPPARFEAAVSLVAGIVSRVVGTDALVDLVVVGETVHEATLGRSLGTLDVALDLLATADPEGAFDGGKLFSAIGPHLARLSALVVVSLRWDASRRAFAARVNASGTACVAYVVGPFVDEPGARHVAEEPITRGEALRL